jgi:transposase
VPPLVAEGRECARPSASGISMGLHLLRRPPCQDFTLVLPVVSAAVMDLFLAQFAAALPADAHAVLVLDGAGWHDERALTVPDNLTLVPLPAYSPELNPVERIWLYLRDRFLSLRFLPDTAAIVEACCRAWNALTAEAGSYPIPVRLSLDCEARFIDSLV